MSATTLARLLGISSTQVDRAVSLLDGHAYETFEIPKLGPRAPRIITAPAEPLKLVQRSLIDVLEPLPLASCVHGFRRGRSIVTGAKCHVRARALINVDLKDFFHSVTAERVERTLYASLRRRLVDETGELTMMQAAQFIGLIVKLCTWPIDGRRVLPQGAPTSPFLANLAARPLDKRIAELLSDMPGDYVYTRYADDLTISSPDEIDRRLLGEVLRVVDWSGFHANPEKVRLSSTIRGSPHFRQKLEVTGLIIDPRERRVTIARKRMDRFRAMIHQAANASQLDEHTIKRVEGIVSYVHMVYGSLPNTLQETYDRFVETHRQPRLTAGKSRRQARRQALNEELYR